MEAAEDSYRAYQVQRRRRYISEPRACDDNYNADNYTKRLSSETATSSASDRTLMSTTSSDEPKPTSPASPDSAIGSQTTAPTPANETILSASTSVAECDPASVSSASEPPLNDDSSSAAAVANHSDVPASASSANDRVDAAPDVSSRQIEPDESSSTSATREASSTSNQSLVQRRKTSANSSTCDLSRPAALSVSSLNSDDLMLTTDVGLDLEDDDIIKDIDDTEKEDPFLVANALATVGKSATAPGRVKAGGTAMASGRGGPGNNLTTPETISSAMSLVQQASGGAKRVGGVAAGGEASPRPGLTRKKSSPAATSTPDGTAKAAVLRRIRAQSSVERPRSFSSPLRPPSRQRLSSAGGMGADPDEAPVVIGQPDYRHITSDMRSVKLLLLRLKGMLLEDEGHQPAFAEQLSSSFYGQQTLSLSSSSVKRSDSVSEPSTPLTAPDPFSPNGEEPLLDLESAPREALVQEILALRRTTTLLRTKLAEKETTVKLLQQQMTKYVVCPGTTAETPPALESLRSFARHPFPGKPLGLEPAGGTEPSSPVVVDPAHGLAHAAVGAASSSASSLPNGDAVGLSPRPSLGPRLRPAGSRRERPGADSSAAVARPSFLPVNMSQQGKRSISTGHLPHRKTTPMTSGSSQS